MISLKTPSSRFLLIYTALTAAGIAGGAALVLHPKQFFINPVTFFLQMVPLAGVLTAWLAPDELISFSNFLALRIRQCPKTVLLVLITLAAGILIAVNRTVLLSFMNSADENSCLFFAQCLKAGKWWARPHELKGFFETAHIGAIGDKWFSVYPPGWPLVWAVALKLNLQHLINPILTALSFLFLQDIAKKIYRVEVFVPAAVILLISPFFLLTGAAYYSHNLCLLLMLAFWSCYFRLKEIQSYSWAILAALVLGFAFSTRYLTAAALGFLPCLVLGLEALKKRGKSLRSFLVFSSVFFFMLGAQLSYNQMLTGNFFDPPNHYLHSHEKLGFIAGYTPLTALEYLGKRFLYLLDWAPPGWIYLFICACLVWRPKSTDDFILRVSVFLLPLAYALYYSWGGNQYGPRYLFEAYPFLILSASAFLIHLRETGNDLIRKGVILFIVFSSLASLPVLSRHFKFFKEATGFRKMTYTAVENTVEKPALVFISGFWGSEKLAMAPEDLARNSPFLDTPIIYALDRGQDNAKLVSFFPGRHYYRASYDQTHNKSRVESLSL